MLWKLSQRTFNGGQLDRRLMGRTDLTKYYQGASVLENFIVKRQGCIVRRRGTVQIADVSSLTNDANIIKSRLFPFTYERSYGYVLAFINSVALGTRCCVFAKDGRLVKTIADLPYTATQLDKIIYCQSGDMLFLAHRDHPFARITRHTETNWTYDVIDFTTCGATSLPQTPTITSVSHSSGFPSSGPSITCEYVATAVINGVESAPSNPVPFTYNAPWPEGGTATINIAKQTPEPDCYNIYKRTFSGFGLIGTTAGGTSVVGTVPSISTGSITQFIRKRSQNTSVPSGTTFAKTSVPPCPSFDNNGYVIGNGSFTLTYPGDGCKIDDLYIRLGCVHDVHCLSVESDWQQYHQPLARWYIQYVACRPKKIKAYCTFSDNTHATLTADVTAAAQDETRMSNELTFNYETQSGPDSSELKRVIADVDQDCFVRFIINGSGSTSQKTVKSIVVTAYTNDAMTQVATGSFTPGSYTLNSRGWATDVTFDTLTGNPFVISGVWGTVNNELSQSFADEYITPDASLTPPKYDPHFDGEEKYPGCVTLYQQRLALAATYAQPFTFWLSCIGDLYNFNVHDSIREDDAMEVTLPATKYPDINHMVLNRDLIMFCDSGEWIVSPVSGNTLTYKTISSKIQSQIGCSKELAPIVVGDDVIFMNMTNETLIAIKYSYATDGYEATDLSVLSQDIFRGNEVTSIAYKQNPDSIIVVTLADGTFATLEYMKEHEVIAWSHHRLGGNLKALYCCADGSITDGTTDVYILAQDMDVTDGVQLYLLRVKEDADFTDVASAVSLDQMTTVTPPQTRAVPTGFVAVDTATAEVVSSNGLMTATHTYVLGRPFDARFVSVKPEPNANETVRFEVKNPTEAEVCITEGSSFRIGQYGLPETKDRTILADPTVDASGRIQLQTVDKSTIITGANNRDGRMRIVSDGVWPLTILSLSTTYQVEMANQDPQKPQGRGESDD